MKKKIPKSDRNHISFYVDGETKRVWLSEALNKNKPLAAFIKDVVDESIHQPEKSNVDISPMIAEYIDRENKLLEEIEADREQIKQLRKKYREENPIIDDVITTEQILLLLREKPSNSEIMSKIFRVDQFDLEQILHEMEANNKLKYDFPTNKWSVN
ncbi:MAG: hypothetical protein EU530_11520 [Promethearchaeota archaeon]|nr:MAG: hypothetical protein EU530_11520 [Candidatus Lokiarchaeota archaeon]